MPRRTTLKPKRCMFLELPVELRLRIAEYALEQRPTAGIPSIHVDLYDKRNYWPTDNLALLLVCRQFNQDLTALAYTKTRFTLWSRVMVARMLKLPLHKLRNIRKIAFYASKDGLSSWGSDFRDLEQLHLDELIFLWPEVWGDGIETKNLVLLLRRLRHIKTIKFISWSKNRSASRGAYFSLIGAIMKEDHFQRYDAPDAPNVEATWWSWNLNAGQYIITLHAQEPRPVLPEEDYMICMKPTVDAMMEEAVQPPRIPEVFRHT